MMYIICMIRVNYYITKKQNESLKSMSKDIGLSVSELIRRAIDKWIEEQRMKGIER